MTRRATRLTSSRSSTSTTDACYTGDAAGLYFPGDEILMPVTPAPAFDLEKNLETFRRLLALRPRALLFSHYGPHSKPKAAIEAMMAAYPAWARVVRDKLTQSAKKASCASCTT